MDAAHTGLRRPMALGYLCIAVLVGGAQAAGWSIISESAACEVNTEDIKRMLGASGFTLEGCQAKCLETAGCKAIDYYTTTQWCNCYDRACSTPQKKEGGPSSWKYDAGEAQADTPGTLLKGHSIGSPPLVSALANDWFLAGTVIPSMKNMILQPGVPNRLGYIWSKYPLLTNDFEVEFDIVTKKAAERSVKDDGFAFWYVQENVTAAVETISATHLHNQEEIIANTWQTAYVAEKFDLWGQRNNFDGVGVFFTNSGQNKDQPTVGAISGDGKTAYTLGQGIPNTEAMQYDFRSGKKMQVKLRFRPLGIKVEIVGGPTQEVKCDVRAGGYIGFSIFGGVKGKIEGAERSDAVELWKHDVKNHDAAAKGEDMPVPGAVTTPPDKAPEEKTDMLGATSGRKDHREESEAIKELTNMVFKLVVESQPMRQQTMRAIESLGKRVTVMEQTFENLKVELDKRTGHKLGEEFDAIKKELTSLSDVASTNTAERHRKLDTLHEDIAHVHKSATSADNLDHHLNKLTQSNQRTIDSLNTEHQKMFGVSIAAIAFIVIAGLSLYNKFRCWEKKHVL